MSGSAVRTEPRPKQGWSLGPGGAGFSPRHSVARGPARKPVPHTQRKLPGVFSQRPGAQGMGTRPHSSTSESTKEASYSGGQAKNSTPAPAPLAPPPSSPTQRVPWGLSRKPGSHAQV